MKRMIPVLCAVFFAVQHVRAADVGAIKQRLFERVFGDAVRLDPARVNEVRSSKPGQRHPVDTNGDGRPEEVWFIDPSPRHQERTRPLLVRVIDQDGDMSKLLTGDQDSDLYVADWKADGTVDAVIDYDDTDGDNDVDEMGMYFFTPKDHYLGKPTLRVWWGRDDGDDNRLWYDVNYNYQQPECQWRTHFSGDEVFVAFGLTEESDRWVSIWENPFMFWDPDRDGCSEVVIRYQALRDQLEAIRYSYDIDNDAAGERTHDYDFSISTVARNSRLLRKDRRGGSDLRMPVDVLEQLTLRGIPTDPFMKREHALRWAHEAPWERAVLTWDEIDSNTDGNWRQVPQERWEGVIAHPSKNFPQIGGPTCGATNKRNEVSVNPARPMRLYWDETDRRLHLVGATEGWIKVDYDLDGAIDMNYVYLDDDQDGYFDRRQIDVDGDDEPEFTFTMQAGARREFEPDFASLNRFYVPRLHETLAQTQRFIDIAKAALDEPAPDPVEAFYLAMPTLWTGAEWIGRHIRSSADGSRYYLDLIRDQLTWRLKQRYGERDGWSEVEALYGQGRYDQASDRLAALASVSASNTVEGYDNWTDRLAVRIKTDGRHWGVPVTISLNSLRTHAPKLDPDRLAVVAGDRWIAWREVAHQVDAIDPTIGQELSFLADTDNDGEGLYYIHYGGEGARHRPTFPQRTDTAEDWVPPNIGWESERVGYRAYWGQLDFFGKKVDRLVLNNLGPKSYHDEVDWGIDALLNGTSSGLGGLWLYVDGTGHVAQKPAGKGRVEVTKSVLVTGPVRSAVRWTATNVMPDQPNVRVTSTCWIYADGRETHVRATADGLASNATCALAPGFVKMDHGTSFLDPEAGVFGTWGEQTPVIGEIGMGLVFDPSRFAGKVETAQEHHIKLRVNPGQPIEYVLIADWRRGMQHPAGVTAVNWEQTVRKLAQRQRMTVDVSPDRQP